LSFRVAFVALAITCAGACADVLDLDSYTNEEGTGGSGGATASSGGTAGAAGAGGEGGALICGASPTPPPGTCPGQCNHCDGTTCVISCDGVDACIGETKVCPQGWDCQVYCDNDGSCKSAKIQCPGDYSCKLFCRTGNYACQDVQVLCSARGPCLVSCEGNMNICEGATVVCGENSCTSICRDGWVPPFLDCGDATCACDGCEN
jgi:hypothetical protein